jgi:hypothetical protein
MTSSGLYSYARLVEGNEMSLAFDRSLSRDIGRGRKTYWPTWEESLVRRLRRLGHEVIFTETE